jgi:hypothetical protein
MVAKSGPNQYLKVNNNGTNFFIDVINVDSNDNETVVNH